MKRTLTILLIAAFVSTAYPYELKILGGITFARSSAPLEDYGRVDWTPVVKDTLAGGTVGAGVSFSLARHLDLEVDCLYLQKGAVVEIIGIAGPFMRFNARVNELSFPLLLKLSVTQGRSPYIIGGGELAWVTSREPKNMDFGFIFGIGFRKSIGKMAISLEGRYHLGIRDLVTDLSVLRRMRAVCLLLGFSR
jgi:hypothetical protein